MSQNSERNWSHIISKDTDDGRAVRVLYHGGRTPVSLSASELGAGEAARVQVSDEREVASGFSSLDETGTGPTDANHVTEALGVRIIQPE